jgi:hypothetical protein
MSSVPCAYLCFKVIEDDGAQDICDDGEMPDDGNSDEEMDGGSNTCSKARERESGDAGLEGIGASFQRGSTNSAWKAPTTEELANIKAASELFKSNAFRLKVLPGHLGLRALILLRWIFYRSKLCSLKCDRRPPPSKN